MITKLRILVVDDDKRMTHTLADILTISGYEVIEACSGKDALEKVRSQTFDCVLTDIKMPEMNGVELHRQLRMARPGMPVILMTAYAADELIRQGLEEGVVGVFDKPLAMNHILAFFTSLAKSRTIVIVDDDPAFCKTMEEILVQRGFKVMQITDTYTDVDEMTSGAQTILLDLRLNGITGLDVLKDIRKHYPTLPVILVTSYREEMTDIIQGANRINAYTCLYKPLEISSLLKMLSEIQLEHLRGLLKTDKGYPSGQHISSSNLSRSL